MLVKEVKTFEKENFFKISLFLLLASTSNFQIKIPLYFTVIKFLFL